MSRSDPTPAKLVKQGARLDARLTSKGRGILTHYAVSRQGRAGFESSNSKVA